MCFHEYLCRQATSRCQGLFPPRLQARERALGTRLAKGCIPDHLESAFPGKEEVLATVMCFTLRAVFSLIVKLYMTIELSKRANLLYDGSDRFGTKFNFNLITSMLK